MTTFKQAEMASKKVQQLYFDRAPVFGVGVSLKGDDHFVLVLATQALPLNMIPRSIDGVRIEVEVAGIPVAGTSR